MIAMHPMRSAARLDDGHWRVTITPPPWTGFSSSTLTLTDGQYHRYQTWLRFRPGLIQEMLPELSNAEREILISGIAPEQWDRLKDDD